MFEFANVSRVCRKSTLPLYITFAHFLHPVVDVSAQGSCTITPINPTTLTTAGGVLPNGTVNVMTRCNCSDYDGSVITNVRWYKPDGSIVPRIGTDGFIAGAPHYTRASGDSDNRNVTLVIPTFNDSYDGNYTCGRKSGGYLVSPMTTVSFTIDGELFINRNISYQSYSHFIVVRIHFVVIM